MIFKQISVGAMQNFSYIIGDYKTKTCAIVDPSWDISKLQNIVDEHKLKINAILLTHTHFDHIGKVDEIAKSGSVKIYVHKNEANVFDRLKSQVIQVKDEDIIKIGKIIISVIHTPGHTKGSVCFLTDKKLITGDTLFIDGCGRTDLPGGSAEHLFESLQKIIKLDEDIEIYPGHDYGDVKFATIKYLKENNPYLQCQTLEEFLGLMG